MKGSRNEGALIWTDRCCKPAALLGPHGALSTHHTSARFTDRGWG